MGQEDLVAEPHITRETGRSLIYEIGSNASIYPCRTGRALQIYAMLMLVQD